MEGQSIAGDVTASINVLRASSPIPFASLPIILAVAGTTITASASPAQSMCLMEASPPFSKRLVHTGRPDNASKVSGPTNNCAL